MTQMWPLTSQNTTTTTPTTTVPPPPPPPLSSKSVDGSNNTSNNNNNKKKSSSSSSTCHCCCLVTKLMRKLKRRRRCRAVSASCRQGSSSSFQCRYDPLSYSLNFDSTTLLDEDYYKFYAFSSRFVATNPATSTTSSSSCPVLQLPPANKINSH